ncbi:MAG: hypothetical protein FJ253_10215 [Phycisphaerae bacterium]|nr:hypothetical protein [Phycisphaerae bacterium]
MAIDPAFEWDVVIIGGGPGGSTTGAMLRTHDPRWRVLILERERFPRDHIGESQLPPIGQILDEIGCWEKVERAGFPVKIGATYTWGKTTEPWVFGFVPEETVPPEVERPGRYDGWRQQVAFQVDRSIYDKILLDHAAALGCTVREQTPVRKILHDGDRIDGIVLEGGEVVKGRWYVDASGNSAIIRRALGVKVEVPTKLQNVAFWDYWSSEAWRGDRDEKATRIHIRSLPYGWIWNIRLSATRYSIGLVCNAEWYKQSGRKPADLYAEALRNEPSVSKRLQGATPRGTLDTTIDWSYVVDRTFGENWFLVGECAGFADPILSAGLTLTQVGAKELAYTLIESTHPEWDRAALFRRFDELQITRVRQHMRFAEYWYSANGLFEAVRENCSRIAEDAGLRLHPDDAFRWLSFGGMGEDLPGQAGVGGYSLAAVKQLMGRFTGEKAHWLANGKNDFRLNLRGAVEGIIGVPENGRIRKVQCWTRGNRHLSRTGVQGSLITAMQRTHDITEILESIQLSQATTVQASREVLQRYVCEILELLVQDHWVEAKLRKDRPVLSLATPEEGQLLFTASKRPGVRSKE